MIRNLPLLIFTFCIVTSSFSQTKIDTLQQKLAASQDNGIKLKLLDTLTHQMIRAKHPKQFVYLRQLVGLAKKQADFDLAASKTRFIAQKHIYDGQADSAIYVVEEILKHKSKFATEKSEAHLLLKRGAAFYDKEFLDKAVIDYDRAGDLFLESKDSIFAADAKFFAGQVYADLKTFLKSLTRFEEAYRLYDKLGDKDYASYALNELGSLYGRNGFYDKAIFERQRVLKNAKKIRSYSAMTYAYMHLATNYSHKEDYVTFKKYTDSIAYYLDSISSKQMRSKLAIHLSKMKLKYSLKKNDLEKALHYLTEIQKKVKATPLESYEESPFLYLEASLYHKKNQFSKAKKILEDLLARNKDKENISLLIKVEKMLSDIYKQENNNSKAYDHLSNYLKLQEEVNSRIKENRFLYYQSQFEAERKDNEIYKKETQISLLEKDQEIAMSKRRTLWLLLISIVIISIIVSYYIWKLGNQKRKALDKKIKQNKKELEEFTKQLLEKSKTQESLSEEIEKLKEEIGVQKSIEKLQDLTTTKILTNDDWYTFKEKFKNVYPSFFLKIKSKGYDLTKSEERLIAMEKLYLDTKEIASMLAISQDSVTRSRSRLRKKINAPKGHSILEFLEAS